MVSVAIGAEVGTDGSLVIGFVDTEVTVGGEGS